LITERINKIIMEGNGDRLWYLLIVHGENREVC